MQNYRMADDELDIEAMLEAPYVNGVSLTFAVSYLEYSLGVLNVLCVCSSAIFVVSDRQLHCRLAKINTDLSQGSELVIIIIIITMTMFMVLSS